jgi:3-hydroxybenzoate 6-monooxygenase
MVAGSRRRLALSKGQEARAIGERVFHPAGAHARLRNAVVQAKSHAEWLDTSQWLYGSTGLAQKNFR